jgi:hypothetical protein
MGKEYVQSLPKIKGLRGAPDLILLICGIVAADGARKERGL